MVLKYPPSGNSCSVCDSHNNFYEEKIVYIGDVKKLWSLVESEQWLENVDRTHLVLASGKL